jgi:DHA2 family multidrug resistance protein-like MFS transporter
VLPEYRDPAARRLDLVSVALSLAAILPLAFALTEVPRTGLRPLPVAAGVAGIALAVVFVRRQRILPEPLLDLRMLTNKTFAAAMSGMTLSTMLTGAIMLLVTQYFELARNLPPVRAGLCLVPAAVTMTASSLIAPRLARHLRPAYVIAAGLVVAISGLALIGLVGGLAPVAAGWALVAFGSGPMVVLSVDIVIGTVPQARAGAAAALNETGSQLGFALGIAVLGSLSSAIYRARIAVPAGVPGPAASASKSSFSGAASAAGGLPSHISAALLSESRAAFLSGMHVTAITSAIALAGVAVTTIIVLRPNADQSALASPRAHDDENVSLMA